MTNEVIVKAGGRPYKATFSRPLSDDEVLRMAGMHFACIVSTAAEVRKLVESALVMLKAQDQGRLAVVNVQ